MASTAAAVLRVTKLQSSKHPDAPVSSMEG